MENPKARTAVHADRLGVPRVANPAHTVLSASRDAGSPSESLSGRPAMLGPCAGMVETSVRHSANGATASLVVTFDEVPPTILGTSDRNPRETQPAARYQPTQTDLAIPWTEVREKWLAYLSRRRSQSTVEGYARFTRQTFESIGKRDLREVTWEDLDGFGSGLLDRLQPSSYNSWAYSLKSMYAYAVDKLDLPIRDLGRKLDILDADTVRRSQTRHPPLTREEFQAVLAAAEVKGDFAWSLAARYAWTGICRAEDVWSVTWRQLDLGPAPKATYPRPSKHGSDLVRLLDSGLATRLRDWKRVKDAESEDPVFRPPGRPKKYFEQWLNRRFKLYASGAGVKKYVHPHLIRASADSHLANPAFRVPSEFRERQGGWTPPGARPGYERQDPELFREWVKYLALD